MIIYRITAQSHISSRQIAKLVTSDTEQSALRQANKELDGEWYVLDIKPVSKA
jgi:hypothetical protein